ncbi:hypothetical protein ACFODL_03845 [Phenylobacterium terrae]|uniref:Lipoprotein n=1 Tax=Phenylobacterium terrae TaxID=2665495 RepID=A0ABW4MX26_9CAUL
MRRVVLALAVLGLAACERGEAPAPEAQRPAATAPPAPAAAAPGGLAPEELFFVGRWAADAKMCGDPWIITAQELNTPGHVVCKFEQVSRTAQGLEAASTCTAEGPPEPRRLRFAYAQSARALMIEGGPFNDIGLVRCAGGAYPAANPPDPGESGGLPDDRTPISEAPFAPNSPQGAASTLERYFGEIAERDYDAAWRLWGEAPGRPADAEALARSLDAYDSYNALIGAPGPAEGAAGSLYVRVPVQVYGRLKDGREVHRLGSATLRRVNDVPGSTPEQRSWRIHELALQASAPGGAGRQ